MPSTWLDDRVFEVEALLKAKAMHLGKVSRRKALREVESVNCTVGANGFNEQLVSPVNNASQTNFIVSTPNGLL